MNSVEAAIVFSLSAAIGWSGNSMPGMTARTRRNGVAVGQVTGAGAPGHWFQSQPARYQSTRSALPVPATDAICTSGGKVVPVTYTAKECSLSGDRCESADDCFGMPQTCDEVQAAVPEYFVPDNGTCTDCHGTPPDGRTLGPSTGMLNR